MNPRFRAKLQYMVLDYDFLHSFSFFLFSSFFFSFVVANCSLVCWLACVFALVVITLGIAYGQITLLYSQRVFLSFVITELVFLGGIGTDTGCCA